MDALHIPMWLASTLGAVALILLSIIGGLIALVVKHISALVVKVGLLNDTLLTIQGEFAGKIGLIEAHTDELKKDVLELGGLWDRVRAAENDLTAVKTACKRGCGK